MKRKSLILTVPLFIGLIYHSLAQTGTTSDSTQVSKSRKNSYYSVSRDSVYLKSVYKKMLDREFTKVLTGQATNFGNFGSISTEDNITTINSYFKLKDKSSLSLAITGGSSEGIIPILKGEKLSSNFSATIQYNFGLYELDTVYQDGTAYISYEKTYDSLIHKSEKDKDLIKASAMAAEIKLLKKKMEILKNNKKLETLRKLANDNALKLDGDSIQLLIKERAYDSIAMKIDSVYLAKEFESITPRWIAHQSMLVNNKRREKHKKAFEKIKLDGYKLRWLSISAKVSNRSFTQFIRTNPQDDQLQKQNGNSYEIGVAENWYQKRRESWRSYFQSLALLATFTDSFGDLDKIEVKDRETIADPPDQRTIESSTTAYEGDYETLIGGLKIDYNRYQFFNQSQTGALHLNLSLKAPTDELEKVMIDTEIGILIGVKNKVDRNVLNSELFVHFEDVGKQADDEDDQLFDRSSVGVRFSFPIALNGKE